MVHIKPVKLVLAKRLFQATCPPTSSLYAQLSQVSVGCGFVFKNRHEHGRSLIQSSQLISVNKAGFPKCLAFPFMLKCACPGLNYSSQCLA